MKFEEFFGEPQHMSNGDYAIDGTMTREEAAVEIGDYLSMTIKPEQLKLDRVRFGFPGEDVENYEDFEGRPCWYGGAGNGTGTKPIWVFGI